MHSHFIYFGKLYRYLENQPSKEGFLHHRVSDEKTQLSESRALQHEIIRVDSFAHDDSFAKTATSKKA